MNESDNQVTKEDLDRIQTFFRKLGTVLIVIGILLSMLIAISLFG